MRAIRVVVVLTLFAGVLSWSAVASAAPAPGGNCKKVGRERVAAEGVLRCVREGSRLRWKLAEPFGVKVVDGLPFARTLPAGLTAREVAFQFAKDWTALRACLNWGPDDHNQNFNGELGKVTSKCNKAVWGTPNAFNDWYVRGRLSNEAYYGPVSVLWEKYTAYGALLRHTYCPESWGTRIVCEGYARGYSGWNEGREFGHHLFYERMRLTYAGETWYANRISGPAIIASVRVWVDPTNPSFVPGAAAQFAETPLSAEYWEYPGCKLLGRSTEEGGDSRRTCTVYWAFRDLSGNP